MPQLSVRREGSVAIVTITLPDQFMTDDTVSELNAVTEELDRDESCRAMVFTGGEEGVFIRHFSVKVLAEMSDNLRARGKTFSDQKLLDRDRELDVVFRRLATTPKITIAAINGFAMGGGFEFCLSCDLRIVQDGEHTLGLPEAKLGILPGGGGTQRLARVAGVTMAKEMVYTGMHVDAETALANRIVSSIHDPDTLLDEALAKAARYAAGPAALRQAKEAIMEGLHLPLDEAIEVEARKFGEAFETEDCTTGVQSFLENGPGKATFTGR